MALSLTDIRDSGLLELYALGELTPELRAEIAAALARSPELREELRDIERGFQRAAFARALPVERGVLEATLREIGSTSGAPVEPIETAGPLTYIAAAVAVLALAAAVYLLTDRNALRGEVSAQAAALEDCAEREAADAEAIALVRDLRGPGTRIIELAPAETYPEASLLLYVNAAAARNYLAVAELPPLSPGEAYQLWSLKPDADPIPLTVFDADTAIFPVAFEPGTGTYAITIEDAGGALAPDLTRLVGTLPLG